MFSIPVERRFSCCTCSGGRRTGWPSALDKREMRGCEKLFFKIYSKRRLELGGLSEARGGKRERDVARANER